MPRNLSVRSALRALPAGSQNPQRSRESGSNRGRDWLRPRIVSTLATSACCLCKPPLTSTVCDERVPGSLGHRVHLGRYPPPVPQYRGRALGVRGSGRLEVMLRREAATANISDLSG